MNGEEQPMASPDRRACAPRSRALAMFYTIIAMVVLIGFMSFAVDWGHLQLVKCELETATNAAARAALGDAANTSTVAANTAVYYASLNKVDASTFSINASDVTRGTWDATAKTFTANTQAPNAVRVVGVRSAARGSAVQLAFAGMFGIPQRDLTCTAIVCACRDLQVNIAPYCNADVMSVDGTGVWPGVDGSSYSLSDTLIAGTVKRGDTSYTLNRTTSDAIRCAGQTIPLPAGKYKSVILIVVQGYGPVTSTFTFNNADGSQTAYAQSISDWCNPRSSVANENICAALSYRNDWAGNRTGPTSYLLSYEFPISSAGGGAVSVKLPTLSTLSVLAIGVTPAEGVSVR